VQDVLRASDGDGWVLVAGNANRRAELVHAGARAPSPSTPVVLASALKWPTAAVVLSVVDEGRMALSDAPQQWLGDGWGAEARDARRNLTLAQLLGMTSGLQSVTGRPDSSCDLLTCGRGPDAFTAVDSLAPLECCVLAWAAADASRFGPAPPGAEFNYNTMNLAIASAMAERAANASLAQLFSLTVQRRLAAAARYIASPPPALGMLMSALDYAAFMRAVLVPHERGGLLSERSRAEMFAPTAARMVGTLEAQTGAAGWRYGLGVWLEEGEVASCMGYYGAYPRANLSSGAFAVLVPAYDLLHDEAAAQQGVLMRRSVEVMRAIWAPLQRALAEAEDDDMAAPAPAASLAANAGGCADADTAAESDAVAVALQAQRAQFAQAGAACRDLLAARVRIHVTMHARFSAFVSSKPTVVACGNGTATVRTHVFVDTLLADVPPSPPFTASAAFVAGAASSPRLWIKLRHAAGVAAVATGAEQPACSAADNPLDAVAADENAAIAVEVLPADAAARLMFAPDNSVGTVSAAGPAWLAAAAVELLRNGSRTLVRSPSLVTTALDGAPAGATGSVLLKVLAPAAMQRLSAHLQL
jgi:CubicO group peptidase (beta-lactamase class C family)